MTLRVIEPTPESVDMVRSQLSQLAGRAKYQRRGLASANPVDIALVAPHDVYHLGLDEVARGSSIESAQPVGQRFLVMDGNKAVASAELTGVGQTDLQLNEGPYVAATASAIADAERDPKIAAGNYEVRILRIPALYFMALWLKGDGGGSNGRGGDIVVPLAPAPAPFEAGVKYRADEVLSQLAPAARQRMEFDDIGPNMNRS